MSNKMLLNVLGMKKWLFTDEKTGEYREGVTVFVAQETEDASGSTLGLDIMKMTAPIHVFERAKAAKIPFPSECQVLMSLKLGAGGKAAMQVHDIAFE